MAATRPLPGRTRNYRKSLVYQTFGHRAPAQECKNLDEGARRRRVARGAPHSTLCCSQGPRAMCLSSAPPDPAQHPGALRAELRSGRTNTWRKHCARPCPTAPPAPPGAPDPACLVVTTRPRIREQHCGLAKAWPMGGTNAHAACGQTAADKLLRRTTPGQRKY